MPEQLGFVEAFLPSGFGRNARLERISALIDWVPIDALVRQVRPGTTGRPPWRPLSMVRRCCWRNGMGCRTRAWRRRCRIGSRFVASAGWRWMRGRQPALAKAGETSLCRFRNALKDAGLGEALFAEIGRQLDTAGFVMKTGTLIDASLIRAAVKTPRDRFKERTHENRSTSDPDANWTMVDRGRRSFFGYKLHVGVDQGSGLIRSRLLTPAKAYEKRERRAMLKARGVKDRIQHRRVRGQAALPRWQTVRNKLIGRVRGAVERTFSSLKGRYRLDRMRYRGLTACAFHIDLAAIAYNPTAPPRCRHAERPRPKHNRGQSKTPPTPPAQPRCRSLRQLIKTVKRVLQRSRSSPG